MKIKDITITRNNLPTLNSLNRILANRGILDRLSNKQLANQLAKLLAIQSAYNRGILPDNYYCSVLGYGRMLKDKWIIANTKYATDYFTKEFEKRNLQAQYGIFIELLNNS